MAVTSISSISASSSFPGGDSKLSSAGDSSVLQPGAISVKQRGTKLHPGKNVGIGRDQTVYSLIDGLVKFEKFGPDSDRKKGLVIVENQELDTDRQSPDEYLFTQDYLDTIDFVNFIVSAPERDEADMDKNGAIPHTTIRESKFSTNGNGSGPQRTAIAGRRAKKGRRPFPTTIAEILPLKPDESIELCRNLYAWMLRAGRIQDCLALLGEVDKAGRLSLMKVNHFRFYEACKKEGAVEEAFTFVKLMRSYSTLQHYTMLLSVCCHAKDVDGALQVLALLESRGLKADCIFYTTLVSACAKAGKVDLLFQIFHEMEMAGIEANVHTFGAMIDGCARAGQLPKAFGAYGILISKNVKPDRVIFNTLINACSRAGAVQRAFDVLMDMKAEATPVKPDHVTYGALISACARGGEVDRALEVYQSMRTNNLMGSPACYTAAVHACSQRGDVNYALTVYDDLKKDGVKPDEVFFSALIDVAGHSGSIEKAFSILDEMKTVGMEPGAIVYSSLMGVCSNLGKWEKAVDLYRDIRSAGLRLTVSTFNALMTAFCDAKQLNKALSVLEDIKEAGMMPSQISYSILLKACEKEGEADRALGLYQDARAAGIKPNLVICDCMIGLCLRQVQDSAAAPQVSYSILPVAADLSNMAPHDQWARWGLSIYRHTIEAGVIPTVDTLSQLLGCLRKPELCVTDATNFSDRTPLFFGQPQHPIIAISIEGFGIYDPRALALFEEASALKIVPTFSYASLHPITINAETMPAFAAEVCLLTVMKGLKSRLAAGARVPAVIIKLNVEKKESYTASRGLVSVSVAGRTGQAVAALLRRLRLKFQGHESSGEIRLTVLEIQKWLKPKSLALKSPFALPEKSNSPHTWLGKGISDQQRAIRLGDVPLQHRVFDGHDAWNVSPGVQNARYKGFRGSVKAPQRSVSF